MGYEDFIKEKEHTIIEQREIKGCDFEIQGAKRAMLDLVQNISDIKKKDLQGGIDIGVKAITATVVGTAQERKPAMSMLKMVMLKVADALPEEESQ